MKFNTANIEKLEPRSSQYIVMDDALEFFGVRVYPSNKKTFIVRLRQNGKPKLYTLAPFPAISVIQARKLAQPIIEKFQAGTDPKRDEALAKTKNMTLSSCIEGYLPTVKPSTRKDIDKCSKHGWQEWLNKPIQNISEEKLLKLYDRRAKAARNRARLEMAYFRSIWNFHRKALNLSESPTSILNEERKGWNSTKTRTRRLDFESTPKWYEALARINQRNRLLFLFIYYTGVRATEAMNLKWSEVNSENSSIHLGDTKNGQPLHIPLSTQALAILNSISKNGEFVFNQVGRSGEVGAMTSYSKSITALKMQGVDFSPHDARRGFIVAGGVLGLNSYMIKQLVNHRDAGDVHAGYQHYTMAELRPTVQKICDHLESFLIPD